MPSCNASSHASRMYLRASWLRAFSSAVSLARWIGCNGVSPLFFATLVLKPKTGTDARGTGEKGELTVNLGLSGFSPRWPRWLTAAAEKGNAWAGFSRFCFCGLALLSLWLLGAVDRICLGGGRLALAGLGPGRRFGLIGSGLGGVGGFRLRGWRWAARSCRCVAGGRGR